MAYTATTWVNGQVPALSAANLNKLTNELESQAADIALSHTLPNWADGVAPALSTAAPLNEMERVIYEVAVSQSLSYTKLVWADGWSPARNAFNLNHMENQAAANRAALDSVPSGYYLYEEWTSGTVPSPWISSTFFNYQGAAASVAVVADPLALRGQVVRLRAPYTPGTMAVDANYPTTILQQAAVNITPAYAHADQGEETWYRADFMFPAGNVFCNGFSNFIVEWHTQASGPTSTGLFAYGNYPLTTGGTTAPKLVMVVRSGDIGSPTQTFFPAFGGVATLAAATGITIQTNHWYTSLFHFKWNASASLGLYEWFLDGTLVAQKTMATHFTLASEILSYACYNYRYHVTGESNIYYDTMALGPTRASIGG